MKKGKKKYLVIPCLLFVVLLLVAGLFAAKPSLRYRAVEFLSGMFPTHGLSPLSEDTIFLRKFTLEELLADERVRVDQSLLLINQTHLLPDDFQGDIVEYNNSGVQMNRCVTEAYQALSAAVSEKFNEKLYIRSAYRSPEDQAEAIALEGEKATAIGASEHQAGLALDVYVQYFAGAGFLDSPVGQYVNDSCSEFGFIIRYPSYGTEHTGIGFEPWHLRYVGEPHAEMITEGRLTMEEYMDLLSDGRYYAHGEWIVTRQKGESFRIPAEFHEIVLSPDNDGGYVISAKTEQPPQT